MPHASIYLIVGMRSVRSSLGGESTYARLLCVFHNILHIVQVVQTSRRQVWATTLSMNP
jgi:hypothetical protein